MESGRRKPRRRGKRRRVEQPRSAERATTPAAAPGQELQQPRRQQWKEQQRQWFAESKRRKLVVGPVPKPTASDFLDEMRARLSGGHFRMLNEKLYTCSGVEAFQFFKENQDFFDVYHAGYQQQMSRWPEQPPNVIINWLQSHGPALVVADFGCGKASLARSVKNKVFSIDLVASDPSVIACGMANVIWMTPLLLHKLHLQLQSLLPL